MTSKQLPLPGQVISVEGATAFLIRPTESQRAPMPWVWYAPTLPGLPAAEETWMFERFLAAGIAVAGIDAGESFGSPAGRQLFTALYDVLTQNHGLAGRAGLLARSRGGLMLYNWAAEHVERVACIAGIYPVCNPLSYPGVETAAPACGLTPESFLSQITEHSPLERLEPLARARVPIFHIHGDSDQVVPLEENSAELARRYGEIGGSITLCVIPDGGHDMWDGWFQCQELVDFVIEHVSRSNP